ncbi:phosphotransferase [Vibrio aphrogenes]|uniref:phosphotransferase n=1 Tax=Vibrio aphrogenes TaxID=1891186 RepID=UPI0013E096B9|nr:phosphotransferase [Vibrio aphrogenes]
MRVTEYWQQALKQEPSLVALEAWSKQPICAQPLSGGLTNQCWKVSTQCGRHYVWRPHSLSTQILSIHRSHEYHILSALQSAPFSPKVEGLFAQGLLVQWVDGDTLTQVAQYDALASVMKCLSNLHQYSIKDAVAHPRLVESANIRSFDYAHCIQGYWQALQPEQRTPILQRRLETFLSQYDVLYRETLALAPVCLCHFDLGDYNIIQTDDAKLVIIDWEYAALASPILDVAISILAGQFDVQLSVTSYAQWQGINESAWCEMILRWLPPLRFMALLWHQIAYSLYGRTSDKEAICILDRQLQSDGY